MLIIRKARLHDKKPILNFCQKTFSWGDYIANVWDSWFSKGNLIVIELDGKAIGICNISFSKNQIWLEGLRINPKFRRRGYGKRLIIKAEKIAKKTRKKISRMLIAQQNTKSLSLAKSLGYKIEDRWWLYNLKPKKQITKIRRISNLKQIENFLSSNTYSESWEWLPLDRITIPKLIKEGRTIGSFKNNKINAVGIWNKSQIDKDVLQIGFLNGTKTGMRTILQFMQNKGHTLKSKRIQVLAQQKIDLKMKDLDKRMLFCLMKKELEN
jgi:GNAT superfamily N-acetyltransferase